MLLDAAMRLGPSRSSNLLCTTDGAIRLATAASNSALAALPGVAIAWRRLMRYH